MFRPSAFLFSLWVGMTAVLGAETEKPADSSLPDLRPIATGQVIPDATFINVEGKPLDIQSFRGNALAITFLYSRCPLPELCPKLNTNFRTTQDILAKDSSAPKNWKLLSITIDPARDTPELLGSFSKAMGADPQHWNFATGTLRDITAFTLKCGLRFWDDRGLVQHNLRTLVVNPDGTVRRIYEENKWAPEELAAVLREAAAEQGK